LAVYIQLAQPFIAPAQGKDQVKSVELHLVDIANEKDSQ
jgi:hypothetical protein